MTSAKPTGKKDVLRVYLVGHRGPEHNEIIAVHRTLDGALKEWHAVRISLLKKATSFMKSSGPGKEIWQDMIRNLSCKDPEKIDNYPHETPFIQEWKVVK